MPNTLSSQLKRYGLRMFAVCAAASFFFYGARALGFSVPAGLGQPLYWLAIAGLAFFAAGKRSLTTWILVAMVAGAALGHDFPAVAVNMRLFSLIFLRLIKTIIAPLIFSTLVVGIAGHSSLKQVGRMGLKSLIYFEAVTTLALFIGLAAINITKAGVGINMPPSPEQANVQVQKQTLSDVVLHSVPENAVKAVADGNVLQVVVFSVLFAIALALIPETKRRVMLSFCESLSETMFKFTNIIMLFAPVGVGAAIAYTVGHMGLGVLMNLFQLLLTLYGALLVFVAAVLVPSIMISGLSLKQFAVAVAEPLSIAFATTSSEAALPRAMEAMEALGVPRQIVAFVMPAGYSFNLTGSTLYLSLATIFVAQAAGLHLSMGHQLAIVFTLMLTSKGVAGVPRATLVILLGTAASFNLPIEPIFIILGIDELMDMARSAVNVAGNCVAAGVVARWEGELGKEKPSAVVLESLNS